VPVVEDPRPGCDWEAYRSARDRFFAAVRPEAMSDPPSSPCPDAPPVEWTVDGGQRSWIDATD
jgi:hypothetical protein